MFLHIIIQKCLSFVKDEGRLGTPQDEKWTLILPQVSDTVELTWLLSVITDNPFFLHGSLDQVSFCQNYRGFQQKFEGIV